MANKYSRYQLQPYVSQYVNPYSVEVNQILRERWDKNKAQKDKIDVTLGSWNTLPGDAHLVDKAKEQTKGKLENFIDYGNYEDAGMAVSEVLVDLEGDRGLKAAKQSYDVRQKELEYMQEASIKDGTKFLDFGRDAAQSHVSYYKNDKGEYVENVYKFTNEAMQDYDKEMAGMLKTIKADWSGISRHKADKVAEALLPTYLNSTAGDQDYRRLTQIDGMSDKEAVNNIRQRLQSFTDQYIHTTKAAATQAAAGKMGGDGALKKGNTAMAPKDFGAAEYYNTVLEMNGDVFRGGSIKGTDKLSRDTNRIIQQIAKQELSPKEYKAWKLNNVEYYKGHPEFASYIQYATTNTYQPTFASQEGIDWGEAGAVAGGTALLTAAGLATGFGAANIWNPFGWASLGVGGALTLAAALGFGLSAAKQGVDLIGSQEGNVRDWTNPQQGDGMLFGALDSESEELADNLEDVDHINKILGTNYKNGDPVYEQLKKNAQATLLYKQKNGGDAIDERINDFNGNIFEADTWVPDYSNTELINHIKNIEDNWAVSDFDILGVTELSSTWEDMIDDPTTKKAEKAGDAKIKFLGIVAPSVIDDTPMMFKLSINGKQVLAESKKGSPTSMNLEERIAMDLNKSDFIIRDRAREQVNAMEANGTGSGENSEATGNDLVQILDGLYENVMGLSPEEAHAYAENHVQRSFFQANPMLQAQIAYQMYGEAKPYQSLTDSEKANVDSEINRYYEVYKNTEIRN